MVRRDCLVERGWISKGLAFSICILSLFFLSPQAVLSQSHMAFEGKTYVAEEGKWFLETGDQLYEVVPDVVTVKFKKTFSSSDKDRFYSNFNTAAIRTNKLGFVDIKVPEGKNPIEFVMELKASGAVDIAEVNTYGKYLQSIPDDTQFADQWGLNNTGQTGGTVDADIDAPEAWDIITGAPLVVVAVADSGVDYLHEDLECNIWVNPGEDLDGDGVVWDADDMNGVDDDGNGLIDDLVGWDFDDDDNDPQGSFHHGTHVAGIVGACGNNATGVIGVAGGFAPGTGIKMMALNVGDTAPNGAVLDDAILYAADMGANVITMSLTVGSTSAIDSAIDHAYGVAGVFLNNASGNDNGAVGYPATDPDVVAVGATNHDDDRATPANTGWGSNFGPELEVVAPGVNIWSTRPDDAYNTGGGTSYASPHVAGLAALMFGLNPTATNAEVRQCITDTAEDEVGDASEDTAGRDDYYGFGRINAAAALDCLNKPPICDANGPYSAECQGTTTTLSLDGSGSSDPDGDPMTYVWSSDCPGASFDDPSSATPVLTVDTSPGCSVECTVYLTVTDSNGASDSDSATVSIGDTTPPVISCNAPATVSPPDAPISFTASAIDSCDDDPSVEIIAYECYFFTKKGKRIDKTESCMVAIDGDTITILDSGGVGDCISWTVRSVDSCGNASETDCEIEVVKP